MSGPTVSPASPKPATFLERHAWKVLRGLSLISLLFGLREVSGGAAASFQSSGAPSHPGSPTITWQDLRAASPLAANELDYQVRAGGVFLIVLGLLSTAVVLAGFRGGERWTWWAMGLWPCMLAAIVVLLLGAYQDPGAALTGSIFLAVTTLTLAGAYRKFFPR